MSSSARFQAIILTLLLLSISYIASTIAVLRADGVGDTSQAVQSEYVDLTYLSEHLAEFENRSITTNGTVRFYASIYMFEDLWLQAEDGSKIMVVTRLSGLSVPPNGSMVEVSGRIEHSNLEGGFYFLNTASWKVPTLPEFSTGTVMLSLLLALSAVAVFLKAKAMQRRQA